MKRTIKAFRVYLIGCGLCANLFLIWIAAGGPIIIDRWLDYSQAPAHGAYIICPTAGLTGNNLPTDFGWQSIYTAVQLYFDGWGDRIIFTGGGVDKITEAEIYAEAAGWLGCPEKAIAFEPGATSTAEHPAKLLGAREFGITTGTALNIVSGRIHSRRMALCFRKAGFTNFRVVTGYVSRKAEPHVVRELRVSQFAAHRPSRKNYNDVFNRLRWRSSEFFESLREFAAIAVYRLKGYA